MSVAAPMIIAVGCRIVADLPQPGSLLVMANSSEFLRKHTRREFRERMESGALEACIIPVAAIEQHLEHLAMEHDWRSVTYVAQSVAQNLSPRVVVAEAIMAGISEHHMRHPGTITLRPGTFLSVLGDVIRSVVHAGFRNVLVLNGHGGNVIPCNAVWDQFLREYQVNLHFLSYWDVYNKQDAEELLESGSRLPEDLPGHAQEFETAVALAVFPENVREQAMREQPDTTPLLADADRGRELLARAIERVTDYTADMMAGKRVAAVPAFHP